MKKSISKRIAEHPEKFIQIQDDVSAKALLIEIGVIDKFGAVPRPPGFSGGFANAVGYSDHVTHWIIGIVYSGYEKEIDNGYIAMCFPKSQYTGDEAMGRIRAELSKGGGIAGETWVDAKPHAN